MKERFCKLQIKTFNEIWLNHVSLHSHNYLNLITLPVWLWWFIQKSMSTQQDQMQSYTILVFFPTGSKTTTMPQAAKPAANIIWTTVPIDAGPPRRMPLRACTPTYPPEASSPPPERTRQLQQSPNSGFSVVTGLDCSGSGGGLDMFRLKCLISKRITVPKLLCTGIWCF